MDRGVLADRAFGSKHGIDSETFLLGLSNIKRTTVVANGGESDEVTSDKCADNAADSTSKLKFVSE